METSALGSSAFYSWVVLPALIFAARILDVSMGTVRVILTARGYRCAAPVLGFIEILIWLLAIGQIMKNLANPVCYIAYAGGFAAGNFVGIYIHQRLSLGTVLVQAFARDDAARLVESLKSEDYGVTCIDAQGAYGPVKIVFTIIPRRLTKNVVGHVKRYDPHAFYTIEDVDYVARARLAAACSGPNGGRFGFARPLRKAK
ncbi:MAG: DUF2179 domain-containing protein [Phycisphaerales bacterium]|nr:MAG: DUF2179 domain-containing protein [Phycisphaerales bacterium]